MRWPAHHGNRRWKIGFPIVESGQRTPFLAASPRRIDVGLLIRGASSIEAFARVKLDGNLTFPMRRGATHHHWIGSPGELLAGYGLEELESPDSR